MTCLHFRFRPERFGFDLTEPVSVMTEFDTSYLDTYERFKKYYWTQTEYIIESPVAIKITKRENDLLFAEFEEYNYELSDMNYNAVKQIVPYFIDQLNEYLCDSKEASVMLGEGFDIGFNIGNGSISQYFYSNEIDELLSGEVKKVYLL